VIDVNLTGVMLANQAAAMTPMGRLGTVEEVASTALLLSTSESSYATGQI